MSSIKELLPSSSTLQLTLKAQVECKTLLKEIIYNFTSTREKCHCALVGSTKMPSKD
jgi:hypothetical protein